MLLTKLLLIRLIMLLDALDITFEADSTTVRLWIQASWWIVGEHFRRRQTSAYLVVFVQRGLRLRLSSYHFLVGVDFVWKLVNLRRWTLFFVRCLAWSCIATRSLCIQLLSWSIGWLGSTLASRPVCIEIGVQIRQFVVSWRQKWNKVIFFINIFKGFSSLRLLRMNLIGVMILTSPSSVSWR